MDCCHRNYEEDDPDYNQFIDEEFYHSQQQQNLQHKIRQSGQSEKQKEEEEQISLRSLNQSKDQQCTAPNKNQSQNQQDFPSSERQPDSKTTKYAKDFQIGQQHQQTKRSLRLKQGMRTVENSQRTPSPPIIEEEQNTVESQDSEMPRIKLIPNGNTPKKLKVSSQAQAYETNPYQGLIKAAPASEMLLNSLSIENIRLNKKSFRWHLNKIEHERTKDTEAWRFVDKLREEHQQFAGRIFLMKKKQEMQKRRKQEEEQDKLERKKQKQKKIRLRKAMSNLQQFQQNKLTRKQKLEEFKQQLTELKIKKPLYKIKEEEYKINVELPALLEKRIQLEKIKSERKAFDWKHELDEFNSKIQAYKKAKEQKTNLSPQQAKNINTPQYYQSRFYKEVAQRFRPINLSVIRREIVERKKQYSEEVKKMIEPALKKVKRQNLLSQEEETSSELLSSPTKTSKSKLLFGAAKRSTRYYTIQDYEESCSIPTFRPRGLSIKTEIREPSRFSLQRSSIDSPLTTSKNNKNHRSVMIRSETQPSMQDGEEEKLEEEEEQEQEEIEEDEEKLLEDIWIKMEKLKHL